MSAIAVLVCFVLCSLAAAGAFRAGFRSGRGAAALADADRQAAVDAAVRAVLVERRATAAAVADERAHTVAAAVDTAVKVAGSALDAHLRSGAQHLDVRAHAFEQRAQDIAGELKRVSDLVAVLQNDRSRQHGEVVNHLEQTAKVASALHQTTQGLREVLGSAKHRGQWGERMAEDVLRAAGFVEGVSYRQQSTNAAGKRPDFTFLLPQGLELNMDVKFPIDNYVRHLEATTDAERDAARAAFVRDVRARVKEITGREYIDPARTVDQVLLFIPNESVYAFIHESDPDLLDKALAQRVVLCSPCTLFAVLAVVRHGVRNFMFERTSGEILECLTRFVKQWEKFAESIDRVGKHLGTLSSAFDDLSGTRRRQLEKELDRIETLASRQEAAGAITPDAPSGSGSGSGAGADGSDGWRVPPVRALRAG